MPANVNLYTMRRTHSNWRYLRTEHPNDRLVLMFEYLISSKTMPLAEKTSRKIQNDWSLRGKKEFVTTFSIIVNSAAKLFYFIFNGIGRFVPHSRKLVTHYGRWIYQSRTSWSHEWKQFTIPHECATHWVAGKIYVYFDFRWHAMSILTSLADSEDIHFRNGVEERYWRADCRLRFNINFWESPISPFFTLFSIEPINRDHSNDGYESLNHCMTKYWLPISMAS